jgi:hypothetical protein
LICLFDLANRELRLELNLSQKNVLDLSYPTFFPSPPDGLKTKDEAAWYFYLAEIALRRLENRILGYLYQPDTAISESTMVHTILDFEEQKDAWYVRFFDMKTISIIANVNKIPGTALCPKY